MFTSLVLALFGTAAASPLISLDARNNDGYKAPNAVRATWDGKCYYPTADESFKLDQYLGTWYQIAGTVAPFTAGCTCIAANYALNNNGTVKVTNTCQARGQKVDILGTATPVDATYGAKGVFQVQFPGTPGPDCPGPNYIVQDYNPNFAIVQSNNFTTLFILSRQRNVDDSVIDAWIARAGLLGSNLSNVVKTNQTNCS